MNNGQHILDHFTLWIQALIVDHDQFAVVYFTQMSDEGEPKTRQAVLVGYNQSLDFTCHDPVDQLQELPAFEVKPPTNLLDGFVDDIVPSGTELAETWLSKADL